MNSASVWTPWIPPFDPRRLDGASVMQDEHGRWIEAADCGTHCPGCGLCCAGYRDVITADYAGVEEYEANLKLGRGGLTRGEDDTWYRVAACGESCPGYDRCCQPFDARQRPETVADARRVLLEDAAPPRWQMQEALLILAHEGTAEAVAALEAYLPMAHTRVAGFAECALDEGRFFAAAPRNAEEERHMLKQEVRQTWENRSLEAQSKIWETIEPELARRRYEMEIAQRLLAKAQDATSRDTWQIEVDVLQMLIAQAEEQLAEEQAEVARCDAVVAEIEADLEEEGAQVGSADRDIAGRRDEFEA
jgi:hypothetical protein